MTTIGPDRTWPVLAALATLLTTAVGLELMARGRPLAPEVTTIATSLQSAEAEDEGAAYDRPPMSERHRRARVLARGGKLDKALELFDEVLVAHPKAAAVRAERGYWLLDAGRSTEALGDLESAAAVLTKDPWVALQAGHARRRTGDTEGAERAYRKALALRPDYKNALIALGKLLLGRGKLKEGTAVLEQAAASGGNTARARALVNLGGAYLLTRHQADAETAFRQAVNLAPADYSVRCAIVNAFLNAGGDLSRAAEAAKTCLRIAPDVPRARALQARVFEKRGKLPQAQVGYRRALRLDPSYHWARRRLVRVALRRQDFTLATQQAHELVTRAPEVAEHHFLAALVAAHAGRPAEARRCYRAAIDKRGGVYPQAYFNLGLLERDQHRPDAAIEAYRTALMQRSDYVAAMNNLGLVYMDVRRWNDAEQVLREAVETRPSYAPGWLHLGQVLSSQERYADAIDAFQRALREKPGYRPARLSLAVTYRKSDRIDSAIATYRSLLQDHPSYVSAWHSLGITLRANGDNEQALAAFKKALELDDAHLPSLQQIAALEAELGSDNDALTHCREALDRDPGSAELRLLLAKLERRRGDLPACAREAQRVIDQAPDNRLAQTLHQQCSATRP